MPEVESIAKLLTKAARKFSEAGFETPELDAKLLLQHASSYSNVELISKSNELLDVETISRFWGFVDRRLKHEPVHRILGCRDFFGRKFSLSDETLIPRPDTEILVQTVLDLMPTRVLEIGTGSGAIAVSLAAEQLAMKIVATDVSKDALETAARNALVHNVENRIEFVDADLFDGLEGVFDLIVSNPPYIPSDDILELQKEVQFFDPPRSLDGGKDGLDFYRQIFEGAGKFLTPDGKICVEVGIGQADDVSSLALEHGFSEPVVIKDLNQINRVVLVRL